MAFLRKAEFLVTTTLLLLVVTPIAAYPQQTNIDEAPKIVVSGLTAYKAQGPEAAVQAWLKGSPIEGSREALSQANNLRQVQDFYGAYRGYHVIRSKDLSSNTRVVYLTIDYEKGPLFARFLVYRAEQEWILTSFTFNTSPEAILPNCQ